MNKIVTTIITASLFTVPFTLYAEDLSIDDMYHNEGFTSYDIPVSISPGKSFVVCLDDTYRNEGFTSYDIPVSNSPGKSFVVSLDDAYRNEGFTSYDIPVSNSPSKSFVVSLDDAYRNEGFTGYDQNSIDQHSIEGTVISVAAVAAVK